MKILVTLQIPILTLTISLFFQSFGNAAAFVISTGQYQNMSNEGRAMRERGIDPSKLIGIKLIRMQQNYTKYHLRLSICTPTRCLNLARQGSNFDFRNVSVDNVVFYEGLRSLFGKYFLDYPNEQFDRIRIFFYEYQIGRTPDILRGSSTVSIDELTAGKEVEVQVNENGTAVVKVKFTNGQLAYFKER